MQAYAAARRKVGASVTLAGILAALKVVGVEDVTLLAPGLTASLPISGTQASFCTGITVSAADDDAI
jgi:phage-related baseplate assembly protein